MWGGKEVHLGMSRLGSFGHSKGGFLLKGSKKHYKAKLSCVVMSEVVFRERGEVPATITIPGTLVNGRL